MYQITPGSKASGGSGPPLASDVNQFVKALTGAEDAGTLSLAAPVSAPASAGSATAVAGTGLGVGAYTYAMTYVTGHLRDDGEIVVVGETTASTTWNVTTTSSNKQVSHTSLPVPAATTIIGKRLYRTTAGGSQRKLVATLAVGLTSYVDSVADASLGANEPTTNTTGTAIAFTPSGGIAATTVHGAIVELDSEKGSKSVANTWTQRQTFNAGIADGDNNQDTSLLKSLGIPIDTRSYTATTWTTSGKPTHINVKDSSTVVGTIDITYDTNTGKPTQVIVVAGGKTITWTVSWTGVRFDGYTKAVV